jgi:hypothetical protein
VQLDRQRRELAGDLVGAGPGLGVALAHERGDDLLDEPISRSAAALKGRRWRASMPKRAISATVLATTSASPS